MKKTILLFVVIALVVISVIVWLTQSDFTGNIEEWVIIGGLAIVIGFTLFRGLSQIKSLSRKEPVEDELSKNIMLRTSSLSYYISIYLWLVISYLSERIDLSTSTVIGGGILGMALIFFFCWLYFKFFGIKNE